MLFALRVLIYISIGLLAGGALMENTALAQMRRETGLTRRRGREFFRPTKQILAIYRGRNASGSLVRVYKLASACMVAGLCGVILFVTTICITIARIR